MIPIDIDGESPPKEWLKKAKTITRQLNKADTLQERREIIEKNRKVWGELRQFLLSLSHNKCWYTEARNDSSYFEVEHFRPKKWKDDTFEGYWWLAFEWTNYRACGNAPNRKKGAFFPLHSESRRASSDRQHFVDDELYTLLDPIDPSDPMLLSFDDDGTCIPAPGCDGWEKERADVSIDRYGLNSLPQLCEGRRKIWKECRTIIEKLKELHTKNQKTPTASCRTKIKGKTKQLLSKLKPDQPFSAVARECLNASGYPWAQKIAALG
ncbi:MAG: hypothetical protein JRL30_06685 [Deltaproteobacteria bacterium]|nr:hypothetical protein [Deltaproteobacteria bacterium]